MASTSTESGPSFPRSSWFSGAHLGETVEDIYSAVCQIVLYDNDEEKDDSGTGFLIGNRLLMTCAHVFDPAKSDNYKAHFGYDKAFGAHSRFTLKFSPKEFFYASPSPGDGKPLKPDKLDFTIVALKKPKDPGKLEKLHKISKQALSIFSCINPSETRLTANIIHHGLTFEKGRETKFPGAKQREDGTPVHTIGEDGSVHYYTNTSDGASGAPVFDDKQGLFALHRGECWMGHPDKEGKACKAAVSMYAIASHLTETDKIAELKQYLKTHPIQDEPSLATLLPPKPPKNFTGRVDELKKLETLCKTEKRVVISGLGGIGKTAIALKYAADHRKDYELVHFIQVIPPAEESEANVSISHGLLQLADALGILLGERAEQRLLALKAHLQRLKGNFLLIFDGIDHPKQIEQLERLLSKQGDCLLLLTSRVKKIDADLSFKGLHLLEMRFYEAVEYLLVASGIIDEKQKVALSSRLSAYQTTHSEALKLFLENTTDPIERDAALLAAELGYHPLALKQAAAFISAMKEEGVTLKDYYNAYKQEGVKVFEHDIRMAETKSVLTTWKISIDTLTTHFKCPLAKEILRFLSLLAPAPIPLEMTNQWYKIYAPEADVLNFLKARNLLCKFSLIEKEEKNLKVHKLVQEVTCYHLSSDAKARHLNKTLETCVVLIQGLDVDKPPVRRFLTPYLPHFESVIEHLDSNTVPKEEMSQVLTLLGIIWNCHYKDGHYQKSLEAAKKKYVLSKSQLEKDSLQIGQSADQLGVSLHALGKYKEAFEHKKKALKILREVLKEDHPSMGISWDNVGLTLGAMGKHKEALEHHRKALKILRKALGEDYLDVGVSWNNIGLTLGAMRLRKEALEALKKALGISRKTLGEDHPGVATSWDNVGETLRAMGKHKEALEHHRKALEISRKTLGKDHPFVATSLNNKGLTLEAMGEHEKALKKHKKALGIFRTALGEDHPCVGASLNNMGTTLWAMGQRKEALEALEKGLEIRRKTLGEDHPDVATSWSNVGCTLGEMGQHKKAFEHKEKALEIRRKAFGEDHPSVAASWDNVGLTLWAMRQHKEALGAKKKALEIKRKAFGEDHPSVAASWENVGLTLGEMGQHKESLKYKKKALEIRCKAFGADHPSVATSWNNVGMSLRAMGQYKEALNCQKKALGISTKRVLGKNHPYAAIIRKNLLDTIEALKTEGNTEALRDPELLAIQDPEIALILKPILEKNSKPLKN